MPPEWNFLIKLLPKATVDPDWTLTDMTKGLRWAGDPDLFSQAISLLQYHIECAMQSLETPVARRLKTVKHIIIVLSGKGGVSASSFLGCGGA